MTPSGGAGAAESGRTGGLLPVTEDVRVKVSVGQSSAEGSAALEEGLERETGMEDMVEMVAKDRGRLDGAKELSDL